MFKCEDVAKVFSGNVASGWEEKSEYIKEIKGNDNVILPMIMECISSCKNKPVELLEIGCGTGKLLKQIDSHNSCDLNLTGIELSEDMLRQIDMSLFRRTVTLFNCPIETFTGSHPFDVIVLKQVFHHLVDKKLAIQKLENLLTIHGRVVIMVPNENYQIGILPFEEESDRLGRISEAMMREYIRESSFEIVSIKRVESFAVFPDVYDYFQFLYSIGSLQKLYNYTDDYHTIHEFIQMYKPILVVPTQLQVNFSYSYYILEKNNSQEG